MIKEEQKELYDQKSIKRAFYKYYAKLFQGQKVDGEHIKNYLKRVKIDKIPKKFKQMLEQPITKKLRLPLKMLNLGKRLAQMVFQQNIIRHLKKN